MQHNRPRTVVQLGILAAGAGASWSAMAQAAAGMCELAVGYAPLSVVTPPVAAAATPVPTLAVLSVGILSAALGVVAWSKTKAGSGKAMSVVLLAASAGLALQGGQGLVREVRAAAPYNMDKAAGGTLSDSTIPYASPAPTLTLTNTTGVPLKITSNGNAADTGTCTVGSTVAPGGTCTAVPVCTAPSTALQRIDMTEDPQVGCNPGVQPELLRGVDVSSFFGPGGIFKVYKPITQDPVFSPASPIVEVYLRMALLNPNGQPIYDASTQSLSNQAELANTRVNMIATAPAGYGFGPDLKPNWSWTQDINSCSTVENTNFNPNP